MSTTPFQRLLALVALDAALASLRSKLIALQEQISHEYHKMDDLQKLYQTHKDAVSNARKAVDTIELEMRSIEQRESRKKKLIDTANNLKEFNSAKAELAAVHEDLIAQEQSVLGAWHTLEQMQRALTAFEITYPARITIIEQTINEIGTQVAAVENDIAHKATERPGCLAQVPEEWATQYAMMHVFVSDPVVPFIDGSCSACFSPIPSQLAGRINRGAILPCKGCFRLLYSPTMHFLSSES